MLDRQLFLRIALVWLTLALPAAGNAAVIDQVIAVVNGEPYTLSNLNRYAKEKFGRGFGSDDVNQIDDGDRQVLEQFITEKLLEAEVREAGIRIGPEEIERYIEQVKKNNRLSDEELQLALKREGQTMESYRATVKAQMEKSEIIDRQVRRKVNITDDDVERYYKLNQKNYQSKARARIRHILFALSENASPEQVQSVMQKAQGIYQRIQAGEDFAKLANEFSEGAGKGAGGDIGWFARGTLIPGLEEVAFDKLKVGQVSEPFRTTMGCHLVKLESRDNGTPLPLKTVAPAIKEELFKKALEERFARWLKTDMRRKHKVDIKIAGVVFKPEDAKDDTMKTLMARSMRQTRSEERSVLSYLNPFSYIIKETPFEEDDPKSPLAGKSVVSVFGVPLFTTDAKDNTPDVLNPPKQDSDQGGGSSILDSLNPFSSKKP